MEIILKWKLFMKQMVQSIKTMDTTTDKLQELLKIMVNNTCRTSSNLSKL